MPKGTLQVSDALSSMIANQVSIVNYGITNAYNQILEEAAAYNRVINEELSMFAEMSSDTTRVYGAAEVIDNEEMTEFDSVDASKVGGGYPISFPLTRHGAKIAWTLDFLASNTVDTLAANYLAMQSGDMRKIQSKIRRALYYPISRPVYNPGTGVLNPNAYRDRLVAPQVPLATYPLLNADGQAVAIGPNGENFDPSTHTHYMTADWTAGGSTPATRDGDVQALCNNITEHRVDGNLMLIINSTDEGKIRNLPNFVKSYDASVTIGNGITYSGNNLDVRNFSNRRIGSLNGFDVWVKPWAFPGYLLAFCVGTNGNCPLVWRHRADGRWKDYGPRTIEGYKEQHLPITADEFSRDGNCGVWQRHMAAILYVGAGGLYVAPALY